MLLLWLAIATEAMATCDLDDRALAERTAPGLQAYVEGRFAALDFDCGIRAVELRASASSSDASDARFELRNLALRLNSRTAYPLDKRFALVKAAAARRGSVPESPEGHRFDALLFLKAGDEYFRERDTGARLEALILAIAHDQHLDKTDRVVDVGVTSSFIPDSTQAYRHLSKLLTLAEMTKSDPDMAWFRPTLATAVNFHAGAWRQNEPAEAIKERADLLLRLADELKDVRQCSGCVPEWYWRPVMLAGTAYYRIGREAEGREIIERALGIARSIQNPNYRLGNYRFALVDLLIAKYPRNEILALMTEMQALADSLDTPIAKEVRESLPRIKKTWHLE